ncbi:MAG: nucleotidyltransferase family protein [Acidobacteriaceae bacterium]
MKGFLLAAGEGTRLRPLTNNIPKCLVPIQGTPLLGIWLEWCAVYGIDEVLVNSHAHSERVREFVGGYRGPVRITLTFEPELLGSAGTLIRNRDFVAAEAEFAVLYADVLTSCRFDRLLEFHRNRRSPATVGTYRVANPTQCGILSTDETGRVVEFVEKPTAPKSDTAFSGILVGGPALLGALPEKVPSDIGFDVLPRLIGVMFASPIDGFLLDIGTLEKYERAQREWPGLGGGTPEN